MNSYLVYNKPKSFYVAHSLKESVDYAWSRSENVTFEIFNKLILVSFDKTLEAKGLTPVLCVL